MNPTTGYAQLGDQRIAYYTIGDGPVDLVLTAGFWGSFDVEWEHPAIRLFHNQLASFCRVIRFDSRGSGASDALPFDALPSWETFGEEIEAVMDAVASDQAVIMVMAGVGPIAVLFAVTRPARVRGLVLFNSGARALAADSYPGISAEDYERMAREIFDEWGVSPRASAQYYFPSQVGNPLFLQWLAKLQRGMTSPTGALEYSRFGLQPDVRSLLAAVRVPTLVLHRKESGIGYALVEQGRYVAERIDGAHMVELPGGDVWPYFEHPELTLAALEEFLIGTRHHIAGNRVLATVLFTDIVESTRRAEELGDRRWKALLDLHDELIEDVVGSNGGRVVGGTGDGVLALFDGPGRTIRAADELRSRLEQLGIHIRAGIHTGEIDLRGDDVGGIAIHLAARVMAEAGADEILVSSTVRDLVTGSDFTFVDKGTFTLKGFDQPWQLLTVEPAPAGSRIRSDFMP